MFWEKDGNNVRESAYPLISARMAILRVLHGWMRHVKPLLETLWLIELTPECGDFVSAILICSLGREVVGRPMVRESQLGMKETLQDFDASHDH